MKKHFVNIILAFILNSIFGLIAFSYGQGFYNNGFMSQFLALWLLYIMIIEIWIFIIYIILQLILVFLKIKFRNVYIGVGLVDFVVRGQDFFNKHHSLIPHSKGDWLLFMPSLSLILIGLIYWIWVKYYKETVKNISKK
ncbi:hypothetical protein [Runella sp.]|uniref:hypothetical protein n=1 Tax=Runella sp. TaxID=1960881 RepID=UPI003D0AB431